MLFRSADYITSIILVSLVVVITNTNQALHAATESGVDILGKDHSVLGHHEN